MSGDRSTTQEHVGIDVSGDPNGALVVGRRSPGEWPRRRAAAPPRVTPHHRHSAVRAVPRRPPAGAARPPARPTMTAPPGRPAAAAAAPGWNVIDAPPPARATRPARRSAPPRWEHPGFRSAWYGGARRSGRGCGGGWSLISDRWAVTSEFAGNARPPVVAGQRRPASRSADAGDQHVDLDARVLASSRTRSAVNSAGRVSPAYAEDAGPDVDHRAALPVC